MSIEIAKWVKAAREHASLSQEALGERLGRTKGNISAWENERHEPGIEQILQISRETNYPLPEELVTRASVIAASISSGKSRRVEAISDDDQEPNTIRIRKVKLRLSAGIAGFAVDEVEEDDNPIFFRREWFAARNYQPEKLIAIRIKGESMEPGLYDGDTVVINTADSKPKDGDVFAVNYEGEPVVKRLIREIGFWWLVSDNQDQRRYPKKRCEDGVCIVIGRVIHKQSERI